MLRAGRRADTLEDAATELQAVITVVEATSQPMSRRDPLRPFMDIIYKYAQDKSPFKPAMVPRVSIPSVSRVSKHSCVQRTTAHGCKQPRQSAQPTTKCLPGLPAHPFRSSTKPYGPRMTNQHIRAVDAGRLFHCHMVTVNFHCAW